MSLHKFTSAAIVVAATFFSLINPQSSYGQASASAADYVSEAAIRGIPKGLLADYGNNRHLIWVSLQSGRLHVLERTEDGYYVEIENISISIGKNGYGKEVEGDQKTPVGVYQVTSFLEDEGLDDFYGPGAYPLDYPNAWDKLSRRTGYGIWLHGLPKGIDTRPLLDSNGCVVIDNNRLEKYSKYINAGTTTMVLAEDDLEWLSEPDQHESADVLQAIERWESQWENNNIDEYLSNYHRDFSDFRRNLAQWKTYKTRVNGAKSFIDVDISDLSVFAYPGEENLVVSRFYQNYESSNYKWQGWKQLLWRRNDQGIWQILFEGNG